MFENNIMNTSAGENEMNYQYPAIDIKNQDNIKDKIVSNHIFKESKHKEDILKKIICEFGYPSNVEILIRNVGGVSNIYFVDLVNREIVAKILSGLFVGVHSAFLKKEYRVKLKDSDISEYEKHINS